MKKFIIFLIMVIFFAVSCHNSQKTENNADLFPDGDKINDEEAVEPDDEDEDKEKSDNDADTAEEEIVAKISSFAEICTGQTYCDGDCGDKNSPLYGQDAQYAALGYCVQQSFSIDSSVENEPTVIDLNTGLEWQQTFSDAIDVCETSETSENAGKICENAENYCKNLNYGGHSDWRLPDIKELLSITNIAKYPAIDAAYFPGTPSGKFWTSSYFWQDDIRSGWGSQVAWTVNFSDGASNAEPLTLYSSGEIVNHSGIRARCVRGKTLPGSQLTALTIGEEKIIVDAKTDFIWLSGYGTVSSWEEALPYCENLTYAGISDWRLPNKNELTSFFNYSSRYPSTMDYFLSSTSSGSSFVWVVRFSGTAPHIAERVEKHPFDEVFGTTHTYAVRCVAKSPCAEDEIWNGKECVMHACSAVKCPKDEHSTGKCTVLGIDSYKCGCVEGWFWNGEKCEDPCQAEPCKDMPHSTGQCKALKDGTYGCECDDTSYWNGEKCFNNCDPNPCVMPHSTGICLINSSNDVYFLHCECEDGWFWTGTDFNECVNPCEQVICDKPHTTGKCIGKNKSQYYCECEDGYYSKIDECVLSK